MNDNLSILPEIDGIIILITSPGGIGSATVWLPHNYKSRDIVVRFQYSVDRPFQYLEGFTAYVDNNEISMENCHKKQNEFIEIVLPRKYINKKGNKLELNWVDVYR